MHPQLKLMIAAQDLERELKILKDQSESISIPLERTKARRQQMRRDIHTLKAKLENTAKQRKQAEKDLTELDGKMTTAKNRQAAVRNPKQAEALELEMEKLSTDSSAVEENALNLMEQEEHLTGKLEADTARVKRDLETVDAEIARLGGLLEEKQELAKDLREERIAAVHRLDEEIAEAYEWLVKKHGQASAVAGVAGAACGGCGAMLLPDQAMKVRNSEELHRCTHCYRYLNQE